ncbi:MAG TPA: hypothetical protein VF590_12280 [Isosphaeraceae bacterium]|jgi:hypothetical protein
MKTFMTAAAALCLALPTAARADVTFHDVTASEPGLEIRAEDHDDGSVTYVVVCGLKAGAREGRKMELLVGEAAPTEGPRTKVSSRGHAEGTGRPALRCRLEGEAVPDAVEYRVTLVHEAAARAVLVLSEYDRTPSGEEPASGGDVYRIRLSRFLPSRPAGK